MIYLKENDDIVTANLFVHKDFKYAYKQDDYIGKVKRVVGEEVLKSIVTESEYNEMISNESLNKLDCVFDSCVLKNTSICPDEVYNDIELLLESNLPIKMKNRYLSFMNGYTELQNFNNICLKELDLKTYRTYAIEELKRASDICKKLNVYTVATDIVSDNNLKVAEENSKVLRIAKKLEVN